MHLYPQLHTFLDYKKIIEILNKLNNIKLNLYLFYFVQIKCITHVIKFLRKCNNILFKNMILNKQYLVNKFGNMIN